MSLIAEYLQARERVTARMQERAQARSSMHYSAHRAYFRPYVIVTKLRQVDALIHMRSIRAEIQPSQVVILPGPNSDQLFNLVTAANLGCPVKVAQTDTRSRRDFSKYLSAYYRWLESQERLEEATTARGQCFNKFKYVQILQVCTLAELRRLIEIRNSGGWIGGNIAIPPVVVAAVRARLENIAAEQGLLVVPWAQFATAAQ